MSSITSVGRLVDLLDERTVELVEQRRSDGRPLRRRGWLVRRALLVADVAGFSVAFLVAQRVYDVRVSSDGALSNLEEFAAFVLSLPLWIVATKFYGLYDRDEELADHSTWDDFTRLFHLVTVCTFALFVASRDTQWFRPELGKLVLFWLLAVATTAGLRALARSYCRRQLHYLQNTLIVGAGEVGQSVARKLLSHHEYGLNLVGFVDSWPRERADGLEHLTVLGGLEDLDEVIALLDVERLIFAFTNDHHERLLEALRHLHARDVQIDIVPRLFENLGPSVGLHTIEGIPLISLPPVRLSRSSLLLKRALDILLAGAALLFLGPIIGATALAVKMDSPGPAFYRHRRVGRGGIEIRVTKFRTMFLETCRGDEYGGASAEHAFAALMANPALRSEFQDTYKLKEDPRVTRLGRFLRSTSLDEVPQLWDVLCGRLSLVGPRALTATEIEEHYADTAKDLLAIRPGVTGYWQVNGRSDLSYDDRVRLDMAYVGGWSVALDLSILARTVRVVLARRAAV